MYIQYIQTHRSEEQREAVLLSPSRDVGKWIMSQHENVLLCLSANSLLIQPPTPLLYNNTYILKTKNNDPCESFKSGHDDLI